MPLDSGVFGNGFFWRPQNAMVEKCWLILVEIRWLEVVEASSFEKNGLRGVEGCSEAGSASLGAKPKGDIEMAPPKWPDGFLPL